MSSVAQLAVSSQIRLAASLRGGFFFLSNP
jgi:hypothetical protein